MKPTDEKQDPAWAHALRRLIWGWWGAGLARACGCWLEHGVTHANEVGAGRTNDGGLAQKAEGHGDHPFGPRQPIWK